MKKKGNLSFSLRYMHHESNDHHSDNDDLLAHCVTSNYQDEASTGTSYRRDAEMCYIRGRCVTKEVFKVTEPGTATFASYNLDFLPTNFHNLHPKRKVIFYDCTKQQI